MHSWLSRSNAVLTTASTLLFVICAATTLTDLFHEAKGVDVHVEVTKMEVLRVDRRSGNDQVMVGVKLDADLRDAFSWNTKQLFLYVQAEYETASNQINQIILWDDILQQKEKAVIKKRLRQEYEFSDDGRNLRDLDFNVTVAWNVMPKVGRLYTDSRTFSHFRLPSEYSQASKS